jgi:FkbH-like protein
MYEAEVNNSRDPIESLPLEVRERFAEFRRQVTARTTLPWGEHCTECVWPVCYTTCELYERREDGACRQFIGSVARLDHAHGLSPYVQKIRFKQWAKLWTVGTLELKSLAQAERRELINITVGAAARRIPLPGFAKAKVLGKVNYRRRMAAENAHGSGDLPDCFLFECFNPNQRTITLTFTLRPRDRKLRYFQELISAPFGYSRSKIGFAEIARVVDTSSPFEVEIVPNDCANTTLYFGLMDFVKEAASAAVDIAAAEARTQQFKCIVWDLDNTLWDGILIEDGLEKLKLREGVAEVIRSLDQRGILQSIASKNSHEDGMAALRNFGLEEYLLYPQIDWRPKSESIRRIARLLNIGVESIAFVDDQVFEREEVKAALPEISVIDAAEYRGMADRSECQVPITDESKRRRSMYREQQEREEAMSGYSGDYLGFLRDCQLDVQLEPLGETNLKRVYELTQRTNQMNFSGNRYQEGELTEIMRSPELETCVIRCKDRFGDYGIVGFAVVDPRIPSLLDLMFSCRVQGKRVEHAVLTFLLRRFASRDGADFYANYRRSARNAASGKVFEEIGFELASEKDGISVLVFRGTRDIPDDRIVTIVAQHGVLADD